MSEPSNWPLSDKAIRVRVPKQIEQLLSDHVLTSQLYATSVGYYPSADKHEMRRESHDDFILIYCAGGKGYLQTDHYDGAIDQGDLFILPPMTPHKYGSSEDKPWTVFWFHFRGSQSTYHYDYVYKNSDKAVVRTHDVHTLSVFRELINSVRSCYTLDSFIFVSSLLRHLLMTTARAVDHEERMANGIDIDKVQEFMHQNIDRTLYLDDLANLSKVSKYHFSRRYHTLTGMTPLQHFTYIKIEHAMSLLEQTGLSISDIAYQLGYDDALYFSRVFKKHIKLSPRAYRKSFNTNV